MDRKEAAVILGLPEDATDLQIRKGLEEKIAYFEHLSTMQAHVFMQMLKSYSEHSAKAILSQIDKPTLIVSGGKDTFWCRAFSASRKFLFDGC